MEKTLAEFFNIKRGLNIDISYRCPLECYACERQRKYRNNGLKVPGRDMTYEQFEKVSKTFHKITFAGNLSDPIANPDFPAFLRLCYEQKKSVNVMTAASHRSLEWYKKAFEACPTARWTFGIDGLPEESCLYRINQDGEKVFEAMKMCAKMGLQTKWQYIIFKYNQDHIEEAKKMANEIGVVFELVYSARFSGVNDPYRPTKNEITTRLY